MLHQGVFGGFVFVIFIFLKVTKISQQKVIFIFNILPETKFMNCWVTEIQEKG